MGYVVIASLIPVPEAIHEIREKAKSGKAKEHGQKDANSTSTATAP